MVGNTYVLDLSVRLRTYEINRQQPVFKIRSRYLHTFRQNEGTLELARGNAAMEEITWLFLMVTAADYQFVLFQCHFELIAREPGDGEGDAQSFGLAALRGNAFDVVGRIAVRCLAHAVERALDLVKAKQEWAGQRGNSGHLSKPCKRL